MHRGEDKAHTSVNQPGGPSSTDEYGFGWSGAETYAEQCSIESGMHPQNPDTIRLETDDRAYTFSR
jgi:hypothetical protein